eukprot:TRINITY_DN26388_c1_g1_i1.p1 TRINITY_DN26388_c1_g1~~TRINITY_DN26388_c1_g1_i1.p1  ORF type:complete len:623 (-),score=118.14 TRINITY_DN26388_c1_g1_i1:175-2043(-)
MTSLAETWSSSEQKGPASPLAVAARSPGSRSLGSLGSQLVKPSSPKPNHPYHGLVARELGQLGAVSHPMFKRMQVQATQASLQRAISVGELGGCRSAFRAARSRLEGGNAVLKNMNRLLSESQRSVRTCRDILLQDEMRTLPEAMAQLDGALTAVRRLEVGDSKIGGGVWDDPWLDRARFRFGVWEQHEEALRRLARHLVFGDRCAYISDWIQYAFKDWRESTLRAEFGECMTRELAWLPGLGPDLVMLAGKALEDLPASEQRYDRSTARMLRLCSTFCGPLSPKEVDDNVLRWNPDGRSTLEWALDLNDNRVFCMLYAATSVEVLIVKQQVCQHLERAVKATPSLFPTTMSLYQRCLVVLADILEIEVSQLCAESLSGGGVKLKLFPAACQPTVEVARDRLLKVLGPEVAKATVVETYKRAARCGEELERWDSTAKELFSTVVERTAADEAVRLANEDLVPRSFAIFQAAKKEADELDAALAIETGLKETAEVEMKEKWTTYQQLSSRATDLAVEGAEDDVCDEATRLSDEAEATWRAVRSFKEEKEQEMARLSALLKKARAEEDLQRSRHETVERDLSDRKSRAKRAADLYDSLLFKQVGRTPLPTSPPASSPKHAQRRA